MLSGDTFSAAETAGTAVLRIVVSNDSIKNATATSQGSRCLVEADGADGFGVVPMRLMRDALSLQHTQPPSQLARLSGGRKVRAMVFCGPSASLLALGKIRSGPNKQALHPR